MILTVAKKEFVSLLRDGRMALTAATVVAVLILSLITAAQRYTDISAERTTAQALVAEQFQDQGEKNPHAAAHYGIYAFKPVTPLSFFDTGVSSYQGVSIWLEAHKQNRADNRPAEDFTTLARFGELTAAYTLQVLLPLLVILLSFPAFAGEREAGTLRQIMSMGVSPMALMLGKAAGIMAAVKLVLLPVFLLGLLALMIVPGGAEFIPHGLTLMILYVLYAGIFLFLTLAASALSPSSKAALVTMVAFWAVTVFAVPRLATDLSERVYPLPDLNSFELAIGDDMAMGLNGQSPDAVTNSRREQMLSLYNVDRIEDMPINFQGVIFSIQEQLGNAVFDKHFGELNAQMRAQQGIHETAAVVSPVLALKLASMELSGTSLNQHWDFARQAEDYRRDFVERMNSAITYNSAPGQTDYRAGTELWSQVAPFAHQPMSFGTSMAVLGPSLMVQFLWLLGAVLAAVYGARRARAMVL